jgi:uncharacterized Rmd1/YagE family protein
VPVHLAPRPAQKDAIADWQSSQQKVTSFYDGRVLASRWGNILNQGITWRLAQSIVLSRFEHIGGEGAIADSWQSSQQKVTSFYDGRVLASRWGNILNQGITWRLAQSIVLSRFEHIGGEGAIADSWQSSQQKLASTNIGEGNHTVR